MRKAFLISFAAFSVVLVVAGSGFASSAAVAPETAVLSWADHDSAEPIDEDGNGTETTTLLYSLTGAKGAQYSLDGGSWTTAGASPYSGPVLLADGNEHSLSLRARNARTGAVDPTPATATLAICPQGGCDERETPPAAPEEGTPYFSDDFERDADTFVPPWDAAHQWAPGRLTTDPSTAREGDYSLKFHVEDGDQLWGYSPRADLNKRTGVPLCEGDDNYFAESLYFPTDFPQDVPNWINVSEHGFTNTDPTGFPPTLFGMDSNSTLYLQFYDSGAWPTVWSQQITLGAWHDVVGHVKWSDDADTGFYELWLDGQPQTFTNGSTRRYGQTLHAAGNPNPCGWLLPQLYFEKGQFDSLTMWMDEFKLGASYVDVAP